MQSALYTQSTHVSRSLRAQWEQRAQRRIEVLSSTSGLNTIVQRNELVTAAYAEMYLRNPNLYRWAGMAALTSASVGRGMYMMRVLQMSRLSSMIGMFGRDVVQVLELLGSGNLAVFDDIYWQHMAYEIGGIAEIERVFRAGDLDRLALLGWQQIDEGRRTHNSALIWEGNTNLLFFEQKEVLQPRVYDGNPQLWRLLGGWITSPMLGQYQTFEAFAPHGNIGIFEERWNWIEQSMMPYWKYLVEQQPARVERALQAHLLGGAPFRVPGLPLGLGGSELAAIMRGRSTHFGWIQRMLRSSVTASAV